MDKVCISNNTKHVEMSARSAKPGNVTLKKESLPNLSVISASLPKIQPLSAHRHVARNAYSSGVIGVRADGESPANKQKESDRMATEPMATEPVQTVSTDKLRIFTCCQITDMLGEEVSRLIREKVRYFSGVEVIRATPPFNRKYIDGDANDNIQPITDHIKNTVESLGGAIIDLDVASFGFEPSDALRTLVDGDAAYEATIDAMCQDLGIPIPKRRTAEFNMSVLKGAVGPEDYRIKDLADFVLQQTQEGVASGNLNEADLESATLAKSRLLKLHDRIVSMQAAGGPINYEGWIAYLEAEIIDPAYKSTWKMADNLVVDEVAKLFGLTDAAQRWHMLQETQVDSSGKGRNGKKPQKADLWTSKVLYQLVTIPSYWLDAVALVTAVAANESVMNKAYTTITKLRANVKSAAVFQDVTTKISKILKGDKEARIEREALWLPHLHVVDLEMDDGFSMLLHTALLRALNKDQSLPACMVQLPAQYHPILEAIHSKMTENNFYVMRDEKSLNIKKILAYYGGS